MSREEEARGMHVWSRHDGTERRRYDRVVLPLRNCVIVTSVGVRNQPDVLDISQGGMRFRHTSGHPLTSGTRVIVEVYLADDHPPLNIAGQVVWTHAIIGSQTYQGGIRFDASSEEIGSAIRGFIEGLP